MQVRMFSLYITVEHLIVMEKKGLTDQTIVTRNQQVVVSNVISP